MTVPRASFDDLTPELQDLLRAKYARLGYLGEFFQVAAAQPDALAGFIRFTESLKSALPADATEIVALTIAVETGNVYERTQHERLALTLGFPVAWVLAVERLDPDNATALDDQQRMIQRLVLAMVRSHGRAAAPSFAALVERTSSAEAVGIALTVCRYLGHAVVVNTLQIQAPVASPFDQSDPDASATTA